MPSKQAISAISLLELIIIIIPKINKLNRDSIISYRCKKKCFLGLLFYLNLKPVDKFSF